MPRSFGLGRVDDTSGSTPGGGGQSGVANLAALSAVNDAALTNGAILGVGTMQDVYELDRASSTALSFPDVVATATGVGRWKRKFVGGQSWASQAAWFTNFTTGNDEYNGAAAVFTAGYNGPLKTVAEFFKRQRNGSPLVDMNVFVAENDSSTDLICDITFSSTSGLRIIRFTGTRTVFFPAAGSTDFTAVTPYNAATSTADLVTDTAIPVSWTASGLVQKLGRMRTGAATGSVFAVEFDLGGKQARVSRFINALTYTQTQPVVGDDYEMYDCTELGDNLYIATRGSGILEFVDMFLGGTSVTILEGSAFFYSSYVNVLSNSGGTCGMIGCLHNGIFHNISPLGTTLDGGLCVRTGGAAMIVDQGGDVVVFNATMVGVSSGIDMSAGGVLYCLDSLMVYNSSAAGITISQGADVEMGANVALFGTSNTTYGVNVLGGGFLGYSTRVPTLTGTTGDALVGGYPIDWTMVPFTNPDELAAVRDLATPTLLASYSTMLSQVFYAGNMPH